MSQTGGDEMSSDDGAPTAVCVIAQVNALRFMFTQIASTDDGLMEIIWLTPWRAFKVFVFCVVSVCARAPKLCYV